MKRQNSFLDNLQLRVNPWKPVVLLVSATGCMVLYLYINRSDSFRLMNLTQFFQLPGDFPAYAVRFLSSFLLLGAIPLGLSLFMGYKARFLGLRWNGDFLRSRIFWICLFLAPMSAVIGALTSDIYNFYPFSHSLIAVYPNFPAILGVHALLYFFMYYVPWEILFRGILIFPFLPPSTIESSLSPKPEEVLAAPAILVVASWQILPTVLMHLPNPMTETLGAIPFGLLCAYLAVRFRSILPGLIIHSMAGIGVDMAIIVTHNT